MWVLLLQLRKEHSLTLMRKCLVSKARSQEQLFPQPRWKNLHWGWGSLYWAKLVPRQ